MVLPSAAQVAHGGKALSPERGGASLSRSAGEARRNARFAFRVFRVPLAKPDGTLGLPFGSFAFRWRSQAERLVCLSGLSRSAGEARRNARFAFRVFRVPLAEPDGTLGLPFGPLPAPRAWPAEPHPALGPFFPRIQSGAECPNPLAGDWTGMPVIMPVQNKLLCRLQLTAGSWPRLGRGDGGLRRARPRQRGRAPSAGPQPPFGRQPQPRSGVDRSPTLHGCAGGDGPIAASAFGGSLLDVHPSTPASRPPRLPCTRPIGAGTPLFACSEKRKDGAGRRGAGKRGGFPTQRAAPARAAPRRGGRAPPRGAPQRDAPEGQALWGVMEMFWTTMAGHEDP